MTERPRVDRFALYFGALAQPIGTQLRAQGIWVPRSQVRVWEDLARALTLVRLHHSVPEAMVRRGEQRLGRAIEQWLRDNGEN